MRFQKTFILLLATVITSFNVAFASAASDGQYHFVINFPHGQRWGLVTNEHDAAGYTKNYLPSFTMTAYAQNLTEGFTLGDKTPLPEAMQVVVDQHRAVPCRQNSIHMLSSQKDMILYTASLAQCPNGKSLFEIFKSFNMPDGNYTLAYAANPDVVSQATIDDMTAAFRSATLQ